MFVPGQDYFLQPGATRIDGGGLYGATRVTLISGPDRDGDLHVRLVDGSWAGSTYIKPGCLVPLAAARLDLVGRLVTVLRDEDHYLREGDIAEVTSDDGDRRIRAKLVSGRGQPGCDWWIDRDKLQPHPLDGGTPDVQPTPSSDTVDVNDILAGMAQ